MRLKRMIRRMTPFWKRSAAKKTVFPSKIQLQLNEIMENISEYLDKKYRILFVGNNNDNKTMTQYLDGKLRRPVFRVDLSLIVSKYIGETEKNLSKLFSRAENKNWILFFDEADALFGKRTGIADAHDKYANIETIFLLQKVEDYEGIIILASNLRDNIDEAFTRRLKIKTIIQTEEEEEDEGS